VVTNFSAASRDMRSHVKSNFHIGDLVRTSLFDRQAIQAFRLGADNHIKGQMIESDIVGVVISPFSTSHRITDVTVYMPQFGGAYLVSRRWLDDI
jgi:hypothetical protein